MDPVLYRQMAQAQHGHWWFAARRKILERVIRHRLPAPTSILEIGCGPGGNLPMLSSMGRVWAMEMDAYALEEARRVVPGLDIRQGWLPDQIPFEDRCFDLICLFDVLEHVEDDVAALKRIYPLLEKRGVVLLTVPAFQWLYGPHDKAHHHFRRYTAFRLRGVASQAGFRVERCGYFNTLLFPLAAAERLAMRFLGKQESNGAVLRNPLLNAFLFKVFAFERYVLPYAFFPFGVSVIAVLEKS